jgi:hypothetical protein
LSSSSNSDYYSASIIEVLFSYLFGKLHNQAISQYGMHSVFFSYTSQELYISGDTVTRMRVEHELVIMKMTHPVHQSQPAIQDVNKYDTHQIVFYVSEMKEKQVK